MIVIPAIDIKEGQVIRLFKGQFDDVTEYSNDPLSVAKEWEESGAERIHIVDLDGAQSGIILNKEIIIKIAQSVNIPVQMGGGIRTIKDVETLLAGGVSKVILGTKAISERKLLKDILAKWDDRIIVSVDCSNGTVTQQGWTEESRLKATDFVKILEEMGVKCIVFTDIARDGTLEGPNIPSITEILEATNIPVIASGGISNIDDIKNLKELVPQGLMGAITGKALYERKLDLKEAIELAKN